MNEPIDLLARIFNSALELKDPIERAAFLAQACDRNASLRRQVEDLLQAHERAGTFLEQPAATGRIAVCPSLAEKTGDNIGRYKLLEKIGEGGCGVVYVAEQTKPVYRRIALKVIKPGMDTNQVVARFEAERQALAMMDHPNIAKVLDAGATETGRPYFVMELVRGIRITDYCDQNRLAIKERLDLFIKVCQAVQHAHQKGIIHRDIKPSNVLVADYDGVPVPKIIDFGIAKATAGERLADKTIYTALEQFIGTPAYMSPEQAKLSGLDIDTRSDIYSLGVLLYELLISKTPFDAKRLIEAGFGEIRRIIQEEEPSRPSQKLSTLAAEEQTTYARFRQTDFPRLIHFIRGDLDWISMKCLEKDRNLRYETVNDLAADLQRHLNGEPVLARPPSKFYRFRKLVRRHRLAFASTSAVAAALVAATAVSAWQAKLASRARNREVAANALLRAQITETEAISKFLTELFQSPDPARDGRAIKVVDILGVAAKKLDAELADQPARQAKLQATLGVTYDALGLYREAIPLQEKVLNYYMEASGPENPDTLTAMNNLARSYYLTNRRGEALKMLEAALAGRRKVSGPEHPETINAMQNLANSYDVTGHKDEALKLREEVLALCRKVLGPEHADTLKAMHNLANSYDEAGRVDKGLKLREEVLALRPKVSGPEHPATLMAMNNLSLSYHEVGRRDEALKLREQAVALYRKVSGSEHPDTLRAMSNLAFSYDEAGRRDEALKLREEVLAIRRKVNGPEHPDTLVAMHYLAHSYAEAGRPQEAIAMVEKVCKTNPEDSDASLTLATWQIWFGQNADYEDTRCRLVEQAQGTQKADTAERAAKAALLRPSTNAILLKNVLNLARRAMELGNDSSSLPSYQLTLGLAEYRNGQYVAAERSIALAEQTLGDHDEMQEIAHIFLAMTVFRQDRADEARSLLNQAQAQIPPLPKDENKPIAAGRAFGHDLLIWWLAYKEARSVLTEPDATNP
jgi:serine/threonine protein kinase/tetratricopeptide (TPR) repeat protein